MFPPFNHFTVVVCFDRIEGMDTATN